MKSKFSFLLLLLVGISLNGYGNDAKIWGDSGSGGGKNAYDKNWYNASSSSLTIENANQLGSFVKELKGGNTFEGKTVSLNTDLDMSAYSWQTVGPFSGTFDGNGHTISNFVRGESSPWSFISTLSGGEIKNVVIDGDFTGNGVVGGVAGSLENNAVISNVAYTGSLDFTVPSEGTVGNIGGIVGNNASGTIENCFYMPKSVTLVDGITLGNIAGTSPTSGSIVRSYFLANDYSDLLIGDDAATAGVGKATAEACSMGEVAWLLNQENDNLKWSFDGISPVFATESNPVVHKNTYVPNENGTIRGEIYVKMGMEVILTASPLKGYLFDKYEFEGAEVAVDNNTFVMPDADLNISAMFVEYAAPAIAEATDVNSSGFTANWNAAIQGATDYLLTVETEDGTVLNGYDKLSVGNVTSFAVTNLLPETTYRYYVQAKNGDAESVDSESMSLTTMSGPVISYSPVVDAFKLEKEHTADQTIKVIGSNLSSEIILSLTGDSNFSISANTLPAIGGDITITYASTTLGIHTATLTMSSNGANDVVIELKGLAELAAPKPVISAGRLFATVEWNNVLFAESYLLTLYQGETVVSGYENVSTTDCRYEFSELKANTSYTCVVSAVCGEQKVAADAISVTTTNDYGQQLNNSGFENWEGSGKSVEPVDWNSFMTNTGSLASMAQEKQVEASTDVRPGSLGTSSARIWSRDVVIAKANGNLTTGRINAGDMDAKNEANYNFTNVNVPAFSEAMNGAKPDSLTVWVKYVPKTTSDKARVAAILHDRYNFKDPSSDATNNSHIVAKAVVNYNATSDNGWQRLSIPFDYCGPATSADYMLVTYTTNMTPGEGSVNDEVYIDDMLLIYNPEVAVTSVDKTAYKQGEQIKVSYNLEGTMSPSNLNAALNVVTLQLSDAEGSFENAIDLTSVKTDYSGTLTATLPADLAVGDGYRVRVVTTNYPMVSEPNSNAIRVYQPGVPTVSATNPEAFDITVNETATQSIVVEGSDLESTITVTLDNASAGFSLDKTELPAAGGEILVTYTSSQVGENTAVITLTATGAEAVTINMRGMTRPATPVIGQATDVTPSSFVANWEAVEGATGYVLTVSSEAGEEPVKTLDAVTSYKVENLSSATEYTYTVVAKVGEYTSLPSEASATVATLAKPIMAVSVESLDFAKTAISESSEAQNVTIDAAGLIGDIIITVDSENFEASSATIAKDATDKTVSITFAPKEVLATCTGTLTLSTDYAEDIVIALSGSSMPKTPVILSATNVTSASFVANWEAVSIEGKSVNYRITVKKDGETIANYPKRTSKTAYTVSSLEPNMTYTYSVEALVGTIYSDPSEEVEVKTVGPNSIDAVSADNLVLYPIPANDVVYIRGCDAKEVSVYSVDGMYIAKKSVVENRIDISNLAAGTYLVTVVSKDGQVYKTRIIKE